MQHAPDAQNAAETDNTPSNNTNQFMDMTTPSPNSRHLNKLGPMNPHPATVIHGAVPPSKATSFMSSDNFSVRGPMVHGQSSQAAANNNQQQRRRRRPNMDALMRSSMMSDRMSTIRFSSFSQKPSIVGPPPGSDVVSVPVLGDCAFEQQYSIRFSQDDGGRHTDLAMLEPSTPIAQLHALRDVMGTMTKNGYIDRATFSQAFEVDNGDFDGYDDENGLVDGNAILIDAVLELDVGAEEKLRFIFDTLDQHQSGCVTQEQIVQLLESNFTNAKLELVGTDFSTVAKLMFRKANARDGMMTYDQFRTVFHSYVTKSFDMDKPKKRSHAPTKANRSVFHTWYDTNKLRIWWLIIYFIVNNIAFWVKWHMYKVDPAIGYGLRIARGCAQIAMLNAFLVLMPMCRSITSVMKRSKLCWQYIPFDDHIEAHKLCGSVCLIAGIIHTCAHISNEIHLYFVATEDDIQRSIFVENGVFEELPPFTFMLQAVPVWTGVLMIIITAISFPLAAIPKFRQGRFNLFWYSHMLFGLFLILMCFHGATSWLAKSSSYLWVAPAFSIYLVERRYRYAKIFTTPVRIMEAVELDKTVAVFMEKPRRFVYRPGMYLFINCPTISNHEWHPFTISSAPGDKYVSIHMRNAGDWTGAFHKLIEDCHKNKKEYPDVYLDGPVGAPTQAYHRFKTIICVGGGIGVTPFASILKDVVHLWEEYRCDNCNHVRHPSSFRIKKLYFYWTTRGQESLGWFEDTMNQITGMDRDNVIEAHQYLTTVKDGDNTSQLKMFQQFVHEQTGQDIVSGLKSKALTHFGRPDWDNIFQEARNRHPGEEIGVFFCGPHALDKALAECCKKYSSTAPGGTYFDYHSEKFA
ncbi:hypothetical protein Poli38472_000695 [Pythium oligandrum]|uniref:Ferric reductase n=1 Tax=Pythium oligandrum TaxID=41045 RepID=A0A8K1CDL2_PYTOL|nr:hypothetical protein Poli38472_000695 [Pythium oligandrum]|eukprot:TMW60653.1 hypothetical protein Poli38472_000695 [Pythium oligandrum]